RRRDANLCNLKPCRAVQSRIKASSADARQALLPSTCHIRFEFHEPAAANTFDAQQLASLRDALKAERTLPTRPQILFVLAADDARHVEAPYGSAFGVA